MLLRNLSNRRRKHGRHLRIAIRETFVLHPVHPNAACFDPSKRRCTRSTSSSQALLGRRRLARHGNPDPQTFLLKTSTASPSRPQEIGRASGRERVCPYV